MKTVSKIFFLLLTMLVILSRLPAQAQIPNLENVPFPCHLANAKLIQKELVAPLKSYGATRERALQKTIVYAKHYRDQIDLSPTINALLDIYEEDSSLQRRIMAVHALYLIGDVQGMEQLHLLSQHDIRSPRGRKIAQNATKLYFTTLHNKQQLERHEKLAQRHAEQAEKYRKRTG